MQFPSDKRHKYLMVPSRADTCLRSTAGGQSWQLAFSFSRKGLDRLAEHLKGTPGHVNLIPLNHVAESPLKPSRRVAQFQKRLESHGITATVRRKLGGDIDASCGQLRRKAMLQTD